MSALNLAESRLNDLYVDQARMEEEMAARIEVSEKLRAQVRELEREKRDLQRRYNEQVRICLFSHFICTWMFCRHQHSRQSAKQPTTTNSTSDHGFSLLRKPAKSLNRFDLLLQPLLRILLAPIFLTLTLRRRRKHQKLLFLEITKTSTILLSRTSTIRKASQLK
jgi:hypothetical protein